MLDYVLHRNPPVPTKNLVRIEAVDIFIAILRTLAELLQSHAALRLEILALRQQLMMVTHSAPKRYRF